MKLWDSLRSSGKDSANSIVEVEVVVVTVVALLKTTVVKSFVLKLKIRRVCWGPRRSRWPAIPRRGRTSSRSPLSLTSRPRQNQIRKAVQSVEKKLVLDVSFCTLIYQVIYLNFSQLVMPTSPFSFHISKHFFIDLKVNNVIIVGWGKRVGGPVFFRIKTFLVILKLRKFQENSHVILMGFQIISKAFDF